MPIPKVNVQFIENNICDSSIYGSSYIIQPDIPTWIGTTTSFAEGIAQQFDLVTYENDLSKKMLQSNISPLRGEQ